MDPLAKRRQHSSTTISTLQKKLEPALAFLGENACVCATGSFGRGEASEYSDLDAFIVDEMEKDSDETRPNRQLGELNTICIKAELIQTVRDLKIPDFDANGQFLAKYSVSDFINTLGTSHDDVTNTFTTRLLMLLEGAPLIGNSSYQRIVDKVIAKYWRDYEDHKNDFMPAFIANDILRLWRTFCVNYEARTDRKPDRKKAKGKLKNYKLKHSRLLTCYSALLYLLSIYKAQGTVSPPDVLKMVAMTPTRRLEFLIADPALANSTDSITKCLDAYQQFLEITSISEDNLVEKFLDKEISKQYITNAQQFGDSIFKALTTIGEDNPFYRLIVV